MKFNIKKKIMILCSGLIAVIFFSSCTAATKTLVLSDSKFPAIIEPTKNINILKIDSQLIKIKSYKASGTDYYKAALEPGEHTIVVHQPMFDEGSIFFLKAFVIGGREYLIRQKVGKRTSLKKSEWKTYVWVEDASTGEIVSSIIKNI